MKVLLDKIGSVTLHAHLRLTGRFRVEHKPADLAAILSDIKAVQAEEEERLRYKAMRTA